MKKISLLAALTISCFEALAATTFCINVNDVCCTGGATTGSYQVSANDEFRYWYIHYDTGSLYDKVTVTCKLDGDPVWQRSNLCGCGNITVDYPTANAHLITIEVECTYCSMPPCVNGTAVVQVYTPSTHACKDNCAGD